MQQNCGTAKKHPLGSKYRIVSMGNRWDLVKKRRLEADWRKLSANAHCSAEWIWDCFCAKSARTAAALQQLIRRSTALRSTNPNDDFAEMRTGRHVAERGLHIGKAERFVDHGLDRVGCDRAVHVLEHLRGAD
jgi:hypothetical protein